MPISSVTFGGTDYAVFGGLLLLSCAIGVYYAWKDRKEKDADAYLVGKHQMSPIPVAISLCVSYVSGIMMIGMPTQVYYFGAILIWHFILFIIGSVVTGLYYIPLYFRLDVMSVYEILETRFGRTSRVLASTSVLFLMVIYMGMVTYIPCLSLSAVSDASMTLSIILTCLVCTFYTTLGGIKAVIWTDVVQAAVMVFGMCAVIVKSTIHVGGVGNAIAALQRGNRLEFNDWSLDPYIRYTTWTIVVGLSVTWTMLSAVNQPMVQRYLSCRNVRQARIAIGLFLLPQEIFFLLAFLTGLVMYAYYENCDPMLSGATQKPDQALPYMVVELFQDMPGLAGIFIAAVYSGTLSTISSGINALSAVILSDFILRNKPHLAKKSLIISKVLVFILGIVVLCMTFLMSTLDKTVFEILFSVGGSIGGPLIGVFTLALFGPRSNEKGAVSGHIMGMVISFWITLGQVLYPPPLIKQLKPISISNCPVPMADNSTETTWAFDNMTSTESAFSGDTIDADMQSASVDRPPIADFLYAVSNSYIGLIGFLVTIIVGIIVSGITGFEDPKYANTDIFVPFVDNKHLPESVRKFFRLGVPSREKVPHDDESEEKSCNEKFEMPNL